MSKEQSKKRKYLPPINKAELWNIFDAEVAKPAPPLECIYSACGDRE
jgi:hypothetical protein